MMEIGLSMDTERRAAPVNRWAMSLFDDGNSGRWAIAERVVGDHLQGMPPPGDRHTHFETAARGIDRRRRDVHEHALVDEDAIARGRGRGASHSRLIVRSCVHAVKVSSVASTAADRGMKRGVLMSASAEDDIVASFYLGSLGYRST